MNVLRLHPQLSLCIISYLTSLMRFSSQFLCLQILQYPTSSTICLDTPVSAFPSSSSHSLDIPSYKSLTLGASTSDLPTFLSSYYNSSQTFPFSYCFQNLFIFILCPFIHADLCEVYWAGRAFTLTFLRALGLSLIHI